jgi:hypothetical protein
MEETYGSNVEALQERQEFVIGLTLLLWAQEKVFAFARTALIAWGRVAVSAAREADVAELESDRALLEEAADWERQRRIQGADNLVKHVASGSDRDLHQSCFVEWRRIAREESRNSALQRSRIRELQAHGRIQNFVRKKTAPSSDQPSNDAMVAHLVLLSWHSFVLEDCVRRQGSRRVARWCSHRSAMLHLLYRRVEKIWCRACLHSWKVGQSKQRYDRNYRRYTNSLGENYSLRVADGQVLCCFLRWRIKILCDLLTSVLRSANIMKEDGYCKAPSWAIVTRGFLRWRTWSVEERRYRLRDDLKMMVGLLQTASVTIEELRIRLLLVRIFGLCRRQVFLAWRRVVEAEHARQIAEAAQIANRSLEQQFLEQQPSLPAAFRGQLPLAFGEDLGRSM